MFKAELETKIKNIFGLNRIIFDKFELGKEQEAVFIDIDKISDYITEGNVGLLITGRLEISGSAAKLKYGWAHGKIETAKKADLEGFIFGRNEIPLRFAYNNNEFIKYQIDFVFRYHENFNPKSAKIVSAEINLQEDQDNE